MPKVDLDGFIQRQVLPFLQKSWEADRWVHHIETAMLFCREHSIPPPEWLVGAVGQAFRQTNIDQEKLGLRLQKHGSRYFQVWMLMELHGKTLEEACAAVAQARNVSEETVRKSYQDYKRHKRR